MQFKYIVSATKTYYVVVAIVECENNLRRGHTYKDTVKQLNWEEYDLQLYYQPCLHAKQNL